MITELRCSTRNRPDQAIEVHIKKTKKVQQLRLYFRNGEIDCLWFLN